MRDVGRSLVPNTRVQVGVSAAVIAVAIATLVVGRLAVSVFAAVLLLVCYADLRGLLADKGHITTFALGAGGVGLFLWCAYEGRLELIPAVGGGLVIALLVTRIALNEAGLGYEGVTADLAATLGAAGTAGILGSHVLLVRALPHVGTRALVALVVLVVCADGAAFVGGRIRGKHPLNRLVSPMKTWEGALIGLAVCTAAGIVIGIVCDPPFTLGSGIAFGAGVGIVAPIGDLCFSAVKRSAGVRRSGTYLGAAGGVLDVIDSLLLVAPAFYWALRTVVL